MATYRLPKANEYGAFWLNKAPLCPAILPFRQRGKEGLYFVTTDDGPLLRGGQVAQFETPQEALAALNRHESSARRRGQSY